MCRLKHFVFLCSSIYQCVLCNTVKCVKISFYCIVLRIQYRTKCTLSHLLVLVSYFSHAIIQVFVSFTNNGVGLLLRTLGLE